MPYDYLLCGWRLRSTLEIPELLLQPADDDGGSQPDIIVTEGKVPEDLDDPIGLNGVVRVGRDGTLMLKLGNEVRFLVTAGRHVTVDLLSDRGREAWRLYFLGTIVQYLCLQRGAYPLHAACLRIADKVVAIAGHRGDGKSTLAFELLRRGNALISDDLTVLQAHDEGVRVFPAAPRLRLWRASLHAAGVGVDGLSRVRADMEKFVVPPPGDFDPTPAKLDAVVVIANHSQVDLKLANAARSRGVALPLYLPAKGRTASRTAA